MLTIRIATPPHASLAKNGMACLAMRGGKNSSKNGVLSPTRRWMCISGQSPLLSTKTTKPSMPRLATATHNSGPKSPTNAA